MADWVNPVKRWNYIGEIKIDTIVLNSEMLTIEVQFSNSLSYMPVREDDFELTINSLKEKLGKKFRKYPKREP